ncbi:hypothetical protein K2P56_03380 [Patescibacteria group bacterium]|nr:hypothetical protein [Patescibacteria group bacterium]
MQEAKSHTETGDAEHGHNGPFCHYCMGQGVGKEGEVPAEANGVLCRTHLNDPHIFGFYEVELEGTDFSDQLSLEMQQLVASGFIERGRAELNATLARMEAEKVQVTVVPRRTPRMRSGQ